VDADEEEQRRKSESSTPRAIKIDSSPVLNVALQKGPAKKGLATTSVAKDFFADFDKDDEEEPEQKQMAEQPRAQQQQQQNEGYYSRGTPSSTGGVPYGASRFAYSDEQQQQQKSAFSNGSSSGSSAAGYSSAEPRQQKVAIGSDSFVPSRSRAAYDAPATTSTSSSSAPKKSSSSSDAPGPAQQQFSKAKSISSTQFFGDEEAPGDRAERQQRLTQFQGARSISSASYYGRDESQMNEEGLLCV
jgi:ADP-ribosylation factor GTPase-activating protein 2/3